MFTRQRSANARVGVETRLSYDVIEVRLAPMDSRNCNCIFTIALFDLVIKCMLLKDIQLVITIESYTRLQLCMP
jgi:hypothetical protein